MSGMPLPAQLGRSSMFALAAVTSISFLGGLEPADATLPLPLGVNTGNVSLLGSNTFDPRFPVPRRNHFNPLDYYNNLSTPVRSILGLSSLGSFGLLASFRPLDNKRKRS